MGSVGVCFHAILDPEGPLAVNTGSRWPLERRSVVGRGQAADGPAASEHLQVAPNTSVVIKSGVNKRLPLQCCHARSDRAVCLHITMGLHGGLSFLPLEVPI